MYRRLKKPSGESSVYTLGNVLQTECYVVTVPVYTRFLPVSHYGILPFVSTVKESLT
jgi:hypothetical protein